MISAACITLTFIAMVEVIIFNLNSSLPENDRFLTTESEIVMQVTSGLEKLIVDIYMYWNLSVSIMYLYLQFQKNDINQEHTDKSNMLSKKWIAFIAFILALSLIDSLLIVAYRMIPTRYSDINSQYYSPAWGLLTRINSFIISEYVKFFQYLGFLCLFVKQCKHQLNDRRTLIQQIMSITD